MEVKINKEIRNYTESMFFGLSMRQFIFSVLAIVVAVVLYFVLKPIVGMETVSWVCILGAAPFAAIGFVTYHGMTAEQFLWTWIKSEILIPKRLTFRPTNLYYEALKEDYAKAEKDGARSENKGNKKCSLAVSDPICVLPPNTTAAFRPSSRMNENTTNQRKE